MLWVWYRDGQWQRFVSWSGAKKYRERILNSSTFIVGNSNDLTRIQLEVAKQERNRNVKLVHHTGADVLWMVDEQNTCPNWIANENEKEMMRYGSSPDPGEPSPPSHARYRAWLGTSGLYIGLQTMEASEGRPAHTSSHYHKKSEEWWIVTHGTGVLFRKDQEWTCKHMRFGDVTHVSPMIAHQIQTREEIATIVVIKTEIMIPKDFPNNGSLPDHFFVSPPPS